MWRVFFGVVLTILFCAGVQARGGDVDIESFLQKSCLQLAEPQLKDPMIVENFCEFVPHIAQKHEDVLKELIHVRERVTTEVLTSAMEELIRWRRTVYEEDVHVIGEQFVDFVRKWAAYEDSQHDEL
jgi:hypothetical protein